jgi:hypothetical protein
MSHRSLQAGSRVPSRTSACRRRPAFDYYLGGRSPRVHHRLCPGSTAFAGRLCRPGERTGSLRRVRPRALRESAMKKPEGEPLLSVRPRETDVVTLAIPKDTLASLRQVAAQREMSEQALLRFYIGQGLRQDLARLFGDRVLATTAHVLARHLQSDEAVAASMHEIREEVMR